MKKILIIRFSSIGDIVLTTPVIRGLNRQLGAEVHFLTKRQYLPLLEANPYIEKVWTIEKKVSERLPDLKKEDYDYLIDLHKNIRSWQVRLALLKKTYSFDKLNFAKWLLVRFKVNRLPDLHIVDRYLRAVEPLGVTNDNEGLDYFLPVDQQSLPAFIGRSSQPYIAFAIGAAHRTKRLPKEKIIEICKTIDLPVFLLGGKEEHDKGIFIAEKAGTHVTSLCGQLTLHASAQVIRHAVKVLTHDTGMMHIAAAFQQDVIVVWGNTVPAFGMSPYFGEQGKGAQQSFEVKELACRPCSKIGFDQCPRGHFNCMNSQNAGAIAQMVNTSETRNQKPGITDG